VCNVKTFTLYKIEGKRRELRTINAQTIGLNCFGTFDDKHGTKIQIEEELQRSMISRRSKIQLGTWIEWSLEDIQKNRRRVKKPKTRGR